MLRPLFLLVTALSLSALPLLAEEAKPALRLELNATETVGGACRLTFMVENALGGDLGELTYEAVIVSTEGQVASLTLFAFGEIPASRPRVRQFDLAGQDCTKIGKVIINGATACQGAQPDQCITALGLTSRVKQELLG